WRHVALVHTELVRRHCTEVRQRKRFQPCPYLLQTGCGALTWNWPGSSTARAGEREVRCIGPSFARDPKRRECAADRSHESLQTPVAFDTDPENTWCFRVGEEPCATK